MHEQFLLLPAALRPAVRHLLLLSVAPGAAPVVRTLLPDFHITLLLNLGPEADLWLPSAAGAASGQRLTSPLLTGPLTQPLHYRLPGGARVLAVGFTLAGFYRLFGVPAGQLQGTFTDPDALVPGGGFARLWQQLQDLATPAQLVHAVAAFCQACLRPAEGAQVELLTQLPQLIRPDYRSSLKSLAATSRLSERTLQLRFQKYLGFSAQELARFLRFRRVLAAVQQRVLGSSPVDWLALLEQHGYYDQPHLIHDFAHFLRQSPGKVADLLASDTICVTTTELLR
ncbi:MAG: DUF6597 domain-containing transcriptional factor [Janthinobacterium lividum]